MSQAADFLDWSLRNAPTPAHTCHTSHTPAGHAPDAEPPWHAPPATASLLDRLMDLLSRPEPGCRAGAALALRQCAPRLWSRPELVSLYGLELTRQLLVALQAAHGELLTGEAALGRAGVVG